MSEVDLSGTLVRAPPCCAEVRSQRTLLDPRRESLGPARSLSWGPSLDVLMALPFFNKHLEETAEGFLLDTLSPQAYGNSCWSRADVSREALLAHLASASAPG